MDPPITPFSTTDWLLTMTPRLNHWGFGSSSFLFFKSINTKIQRSHAGPLCLRDPPQTATILSACSPHALFLLINTSQLPVWRVYAGYAEQH